MYVIRKLLATYAMQFFFFFVVAVAVVTIQSRIIEHINEFLSWNKKFEINLNGLAILVREKGGEIVIKVVCNKKKMGQTHGFFS